MAGIVPKQRVARGRWYGRSDRGYEQIEPINAGMSGIEKESD